MSFFHHRRVGRTVTITFTPAETVWLEDNAARSGVTPDEYVRRMATRAENAMRDHMLTLAPEVRAAAEASERGDHEDDDEAAARIHDTMKRAQRLMLAMNAVAAKIGLAPFADVAPEADDDDGGEPAQC
jgi:hypothetical protein